MSRARNLAARLALAFLSALGSLAILEISLRLFGPPPPSPEDNLRTYTVYDRDLGWRGRPGAHGSYRTSGLSVSVELNSGGWRDEEPLVPEGAAAPTPITAGPHRPRGPRQIAVLGDSFAWGYGVERSETFAQRLETALPGWRVQNYGICGYGTDQELLVLRGSALRILPAAVIVEFAVGNDIDNILSPRAYRLPKPRFVLGDDGRLQLAGVPVPRTENWEKAARTGARDFLTQHLRLYAWVRPRWATLKPRLGRVLGLLRDDMTDSVRLRLYARSEPEKVSRGWKLAEAIFAAMRDDAAKAGARLLILVVPDRLQIEDSLWAEAVREFHLDPAAYDRDLPDRRLEEIGERLGVVIVDPLSRLRDEAAHGKALFIPADPHWNEEGHRVAAEALLPAVWAAVGE